MHSYKHNTSESNINNSHCCRCCLHPSPFVNSLPLLIRHIWTSPTRNHSAGGTNQSYCIDINSIRPDFRHTSLLWNLYNFLLFSHQSFSHIIAVIAERFPLRKTLDHRLRNIWNANQIMQLFNFALEYMYQAHSMRLWSKHNLMANGGFSKIAWFANSPRSTWLVYGWSCNESIVLSLLILIQRSIMCLIFLLFQK